jgi:hypothetical protein
MSIEVEMEVEELQSAIVEVRDWVGWNCDTNPHYILDIIRRKDEEYDNYSFTKRELRIIYFAMCLALGEKAC